MKLSALLKTQDGRLWAAIFALGYRKWTCSACGQHFYEAKHVTMPRCIYCGK